MAELVDAEESESSIFDVQVQVLSAAPYENNNFDMLNIRVFSFLEGENALFSKFWSVQSKKIEHNSVSKLFFSPGSRQQNEINDGIRNVLVFNIEIEKMY